MGGGFAEGIPSKSCIGAYVFRRTDGEPHSNAASERTFSMGNNIGKVLSVFAMAKRFLNYTML